MRSIQLLRSLFLGLVLAGMAGYPISVFAAEQGLIDDDHTWSYNDSHTDLGTAWRAVGYNDSAWPTGEGALGFAGNDGGVEPVSVGTMQTILNRGGDGNPTYYFRTHFNFSGNPAGLTMTITAAIDDGAVFYLNGVEVARVGMATTGTISYSSFATRTDDAGTRVDTLMFSAGSLVNGDNVLAVEVHQVNAGSSDIAMGLRLSVSVPTPGPPVFLTDLLDQEVGQGEPVTFEVTVDGTPPYTFQWKKDGEDIPGANSSSYMISNAGNSHEGVYSVVVSNPVNPAGVISEGALLTVLDGPVTLVTFGSVWSYEDSDTDLGTGWRETSFNDSGWSSGASPLGFPAGETLPDYPAGSGTALTVEEVLLRTEGNFTYYFRNEFTFEGEPLDYNLEVTTLFDDGAVIYLNGQELLRVGMAEGVIDASTQADRTVGEAGLETFTVPSDLLLDGPNVFAVESHQVSGTSSDIIMGLRIVAQPLPPTRIGILVQPESIEVEELKPAVFSVQITGNTPRFQWFRIDGLGENPIPGATRPTYTITNTALADDGAQFYVVISNVVNRVVSETVSLSVIPDVNPPVIVRADGTPNSTTVIVSFSELIGETKAETKTNYRIADTEGGPNLTISTAVLTNGTNVVLTTSARAANKNYILTVNNVEDIAPTPNVIAANSMRPVSSLFVLVGFSRNWQYWDPAVVFDEFPITGTDWYTDPNFDVADQTPPGEYYPWFWRNGNGAFVNSADASELPVPTRKQLSQTVYHRTIFRTIFGFAGGSPAGATVRLRHLVDDGAIFYVNGIEVLRYNLPQGTVDSDTAAVSTIGSASIQTVEIPVGVLQSGDNLFAVGLHQTSIRNVDKVFAMELIATVESIDVGPVAITSDPEDQTVIEGQPVTFSYVGAGGTSFQWRVNGSPIMGATGPTFTIPAVALADNGKAYSVEVINDRDSETSGAGTLTVLSDTTPPQVVSAVGSGNKVTVTFNEPISTASGNQLGHYIVTTDDDGIVGVTSAVTANNQVVLTLASNVGVGDRVRIMNIRDASVAGNIMPKSALFTIGLGGVFLDWDQEWRYDDSNTDLMTAWRQPAYNDAAWPMGLGLLGEETASIPQPINTEIAAPQVSAQPPSGGPLTTYYRTHFDMQLTVSELVLRYIVDDGVVFYLNGTEIHRIGVGAGQSHTNLATRSVGDAVEEVAIITLEPGVLIQGQNVLAAEVHQTSATSSDTVFGARIELEQIPSLRIFEPEAPSLSITAEGLNQVRISWEITEGSFVLEQAITIRGPWAAFPASVTAPPATSVLRARFGAARYYRLRQQ